MCGTVYSLLRSKAEILVVHKQAKSFASIAQKTINLALVAVCRLRFIFCFFAAYFIQYIAFAFIYW